ncbi:hypothetical protein EF918_24075 [Streptomyces sp. WAC06614]|nr:hypothetical protein EF918_24075 [Streptomyces sp. WAC06614]
MIVLPSELEIPPGPHRNLLAALHDLYRLAGFPSTRKISEAIARSEFARDSMSHQTVANILTGRRVPRWLKVEALVDALFTLARRETILHEVDRFRSLWLSMHHPEAERPDPKLTPTAASSPHATESTKASELVEPGPTQACPPPLEGKPELWQVLLESSALGESSLPTRLVAAGWNGPEMFDVSFLPGMCQVELNLRHPMGKEMWEVMDGRDEKAATILALLLISWARMEDEMPSGRAMERVKNARTDWGRYARLYVEQLRT